MVGARKAVYVCYEHGPDPDLMPMFPSVTAVVDCRKDTGHRRPRIPQMIACVRSSCVASYCHNPRPEGCQCGQRAVVMPNNRV